MAESAVQENGKFGCSFAISSTVNADIRYQSQFADLRTLRGPQQLTVVYVRNLPLQGSVGAFCRAPGRLNQ